MLLISGCSKGSTPSIVNEETFKKVTEEEGFVVDDISEMLQGMESEAAYAASEGAGKHFQYFVLTKDADATLLYNQLKSSLSMSGFTEDQVLTNEEHSYVVQNDELYARVDRSGNTLLFSVSQPSELNAFKAIAKKLGINP